jgi:pimeloyl-ACP methyl ester carboxylesterase
MAIILVSCKNDVPYSDISFYSEAFRTERMYRIYLPKNYNKNSDNKYPVIYYFHGFGGRYKWDSHNVTDDIYYPANGRKEPPLVMEWKTYAKDHDVIIVTWDGYEPNLNPGLKFREGIKYGNCKPYDYIRAHDMGKDKFWGWDYRAYFRDLVKDVDSRFRTIADRDHRAVTGLSMGGLTSLYIAGQCRDIVGAISTFDPADNLPYYGPEQKQVVFPVLEMYRSLKGLPVRLTMTDGDWLKYNDWEMKRIFDAADLTSFEFHYADYPDHWAGDPYKQLDFHMREFGKKHPVPENWGHVCTAYPEFDAWGYRVKVQRDIPALSLLENVSKRNIKVLARKFIPDGPIIQNENISVSTSDIYAPSEMYRLIIYNLSSGKIQDKNMESSVDGKLNFKLGGGGHLIGINRDGTPESANIRIVQKHNRDYYYFEEGKSDNIGFSLVNVGNADAKNIKIRAFTNHPYLHLTDSIVSVPALNSASSIALNNRFDFEVSHYSDSSFVGTLFFEVSVAGAVADTQRVMFFTTPKALEITGKSDIIILDGRTVKDVPVYRQGPNKIGKGDISGGNGNGDGVLNRGEEVLVNICLAKGMAPNDSATYHRTFLLNCFDDPYLKVNRLNYEERLRQASKSHISTVLSIDKNTPAGHVFNLWFKVESLYNDKNDPDSRAAIYAHHYDYRRVQLKLGEI